MLVGDDVVFVFWVGRLVLGRNVDFFVGEVWGPIEFLLFEDVWSVGGEIWVEVRVGYFEEVGDAGLV